MSIRAMMPALALATGVVLAGCSVTGPMETSSRASSKSFLMEVPVPGVALPVVSADLPF